MNGDDEFRVIGRNHDSDQITAYVSKVAWVTIRISIDLHWIRDDPPNVALSPAFPAHFILGVAGKSHAPLRAQRSDLSPS
jgi:hypothetical protein